MAGATLAMKITGASLSVNTGSSSATTAGTTTLTLTLTIEATASAAAVPLAVAAKEVTKSDPQEAKGMVGKALTLNYDDTTGVVTSLT